MRRLVSFTAACVLGLSSIVNAESGLDCPMERAPFSLDLALSDVLANEQARAILVNTAPQQMRVFGDENTPSKLPPGFTNILSPRHILASNINVGEEKKASIDAELRKIDVTKSDMKSRCQRYDDDRPDIPKLVPKKPAVLVFEKITGFRDVPSVNAAHSALQSIAKRRSWQVVFSDKAGIINSEDLEKFDVVVWNNVSGDVLTLTQREAFKSYMESGGGFVGIHGAGGDLVYFWDWYVDELIGARFSGHPADPQFQTARVIVENPKTGITEGLPSEWSMLEEWYSFELSPREQGAEIALSIDESSYSLVGYRGADIRMGDHPLAWSKCVDKGRSFYTALGHRPEVYSEENSDH